jgi:hypothetical protein
MNEALKHPDGAAASPGEDFTSDQAIETAALAGAAAVQRLVAERNNLRNRLALQQREISALRAFNDELRRRLMVIHQHYVEAAKSVVGELEEFDATLRDVIKEGVNGAAPRPAPPAASASLAQRLAETETPIETDSEMGTVRPRP